MVKGRGSEAARRKVRSSSEGRRGEIVSGKEGVQSHNYIKVNVAVMYFI